MSKNVIPLDEAEKWTKNWREKCPDNCKAFLIPTEDLVEVLEEMNILKKTKKGNYKLKKTKGKDVRAYMAIDPETKEGGGEKLLIVGTKLGKDGVYRDMIPNRKDDYELGDGDEDIYDFTSPCPNKCDSGSPLFGG